ncbi:MAG: hypothetical protein H6510_05265 [Acidobacteria bacterium]|nr:hypothetical protein [Acidobacteriota bacterium]MCB9397204.1 hypothetical protein [Acidobacteriota bacterium]
MPDSDRVHYSVSLMFENVALPPFQDILVLTKKSPHGKLGVISSLNYLQPEQFEVLEVEHEIVEALLINRRILKRLSAPKIIEILNEKVFPFVEKGEVVKVDFKVRISYENLYLKDVTPDGHPQPNHS